MNTRTAPQNRVASVLFGVLIGFVIGLVVAGVVAVWIFNSSNFRSESTPPAKLEPLTPKVKPAPKAPDDPKSESERIVAPDPEQTPATPPKQPPKQEPVKEAPKEAAKADTKAANTSAAAVEPSPSAEPRGRIWLQVGAYINSADAESQRARFAVLGYEAQIQKAEVEGKGTIYRVRVGPYKDAEEASRIRGDLARQGVEVSIARPSGG